jgi:hypothetical protein
MRGRQLALAAQRKDPRAPLPRRLNAVAIKPWTPRSYTQLHTPRSFSENLRRKIRP